MPRFEGENMDTRIDPVLNVEEKLHVFITHDETLFHANDGLESRFGATTAKKRSGSDDPR